ncbi:MAG: ATP synthase F1 subunit gamma [Myxococcota bacterium]|nr:ATP synthase F1 subunit gamma [Myxococcota bacterium]
MPNLRDIQRRITSVESTQKITSAMKMVSAAKLRRAQQAVESARPYATHMREALEAVAAGETDAENPLLVARESVKTLGVVVITSDRGLAGAFNNQVLKRAEALIAEREAAGQAVCLYLLGRKAGDFFSRRRSHQIVLRELVGNQITYPQAVAVAAQLAAAFEREEFDEAVLVFNEFVTTMVQQPATQPLLPIVAAASEEAGDEDPEATAYTIEPDAQQLLATLAPKTLEVSVFQALLENQAGEHAARMTAMENATRNSEDLIETLTLQFNRVRQAAITRELVEIVTGAQALE